MREELLEQAIRDSWDALTCYPGCADKWSSQNSSLGQCAVTALVVQEYTGGSLLFCEHNNHYWNLLPDGREVDLTRDQFPDDMVPCRDEVRTRDYVLHSAGAVAARTPLRYELLKSRVHARLHQ